MAFHKAPVLDLYYTSCMLAPSSLLSNTSLSTFMDMLKTMLFILNSLQTQESQTTAVTLHAELFEEVCKWMVGSAFKKNGAKTEIILFWL